MSDPGRWTDRLELALLQVDGERHGVFAARIRGEGCERGELVSGSRDDCRRCPRRGRELVAQCDPPTRCQSQDDLRVGSPAGEIWGTELDLQVVADELFVRTSRAERQGDSEWARRSGEGGKPGAAPVDRAQHTPLPR